MLHFSNFSRYGHHSLKHSAAEMPKVICKMADGKGEDETVLGSYSATLRTYSF